MNNVTGWGIEITEEQRQKAYEMIEWQRAEAVLWLPVWNIADYVNKNLLTNEDLVNFRSGWVNQYLKSILDICVTNPNLIKKNQEVLVELEEELAKFGKITPDHEDFEVWSDLRATRMATIHQIIQYKNDINNRKEELKNYEATLVQLTGLI